MRPMSSRSARIEDLLANADWLRRLATHVVHGPDEDDIVQETWLAALRSPPDGDRPPRPWLAEVLRNFARKRARAERISRTSDLELAAAGGVPSAHTLLERAEAQQILAELVVGLPEPYRATVMLRYHEGLSSAAIAAAQAIPAGTVRWRLKEGLDRLRVGLDARYQGDRRAWALVLLPPLRPRPSPLTGVLIAAAKTKLGSFGVLAALLLAIGGGAVWQIGGIQVSVPTAGAPSPHRPTSRPGAGFIPGHELGASEKSGEPLVVPVETLGSGAIPAAADTEIRMLGFDFEDGLIPPGSYYGAIAEGVCPPGSRHCLVGTVNPRDRAAAVAVQIASAPGPAPPLFAYNSKQVLRFDYWLGMDSARFLVLLWVTDKHQNYKVVLSTSIRETWARAEVRLADLVGVRRDDALKDGDAVKGIMICGGRAGGSPLYIDNIEVVEVPAARMPAATSVGRRLGP